MAIAFRFGIHLEPGPPAIVVASKDGRTISYGRPQGEEQIEPTPAQWAAFARAVDRAGVWAWEREYADPGVIDGSSWALLLRDGERRIRAEGMNAEPAGFEAFVRAVRRLIGGRPLE